MSGKSDKAISGGNENQNSVVLFGGWVLYEVLMRVAKQRGEDEMALCSTLAVTKGFFSMVGSGARHANTLSDDFLRACSTYLKIPYLLVLIIAGRIAEQDLLELGIYADTDFGGVLKASRALAMGKN